jgi:hypothetical protein
MTATILNPFDTDSESEAMPLPVFAQRSGYAKLPQSPVNASPVPHLTSLYHFDGAADCGDRNYPGNGGGNLIRDLLRFYQPANVFDPMTGSGTCRDVCRDLGVECHSSDLHQNIDACDASQLPRERFEFAWIHPPYWRQKLYTTDVRDLSRTPTLEAFLERYRLLIANCAESLLPGGKLAILIGDYIDRDVGFVSLTFHTKQIAFGLGLRQACPDIIRFSHGTTSSRKVYRTSFIPQLHDVCMVFRKGGSHVR